MVSPIIQVTTDNWCESVQRSEVIFEKYKALDQSSDLELRFSGVVLQYYPNVWKILNIRMRRTHEQRREAKTKREDNQI